MKHHLHTEIEIDAPADTVWEILTDLDGYEEWNPFIVSATGEAAVGERLTNEMHAPDSKPMTFKPTVTEVEHARVFEWLGRLGLPHVFDGRHRFELHDAPHGGTRLVHTEVMNGVLVPSLRKSLDSKTLAGFEAMNAAIKSRAEARVGSAS